jgi:hypothetical protein
MTEKRKFVLVDERLAQRLIRGGLQAPYPQKRGDQWYVEADKFKAWQESARGTGAEHE